MQDGVMGGRIRVVGQYNITQEQRQNTDDTVYQMWVFDEGSLIWTPPPFYEVNGVTVTLDANSRSAAEAWLQTVAYEVIGYIKLKNSEHL